MQRNSGIPFSPFEFSNKDIDKQSDAQLEHLESLLTAKLDKKYYETRKEMVSSIIENVGAEKALANAIYHLQSNSNTDAVSFLTGRPGFFSVVVHLHDRSTSVGSFTNNLNREKFSFVSSEIEKTRTGGFIFDVECKNYQDFKNNIREMSSVKSFEIASSPVLLVNERNDNINAPPGGGRGRSSGRSSGSRERFGGSRDRSDSDRSSGRDRFGSDRSSERFGGSRDRFGSDRSSRRSSRSSEDRSGRFEKRVKKDIFGSSESGSKSSNLDFLF